MQARNILAAFDGEAGFCSSGTLRNVAAQKRTLFWVVSTNQMNTATSTATSGTANNPIELQPLDLAIDDPPTKAQVEAIRDRLNDLINALKRS